MIHYELRQGEASQFHTLDADEYWFFYAGSMLELYKIDNGRLPKYRLGLEDCAEPCVLMKASTIFDAKHLSDQDEATLIHLILILPHFPFGGGMLYLKSINFLKFCPHVQCLAERWTTTDG